MTECRRRLIHHADHSVAATVTRQFVTRERGTVIRGSGECVTNIGTILVNIIMHAVIK